MTSQHQRWEPNLLGDKEGVDLGKLKITAERNSQYVSKSAPSLQSHLELMDSPK